MKKPRSVFVFGSNLRGLHGAGAALTASREYGAMEGIGVGFASQHSYALPTKNQFFRTLPLRDIADEVRIFCALAADLPEDTFVVTRIGCGLAGYTDAQIAPFFKDAPENCELPEGWRDV